MPRDKTREEANSNWTTTLVDAGEAVAFVSAGAAAFYRANGGKKVSRFINKARRVHEVVRKEIASRSYNDWNNKELKKAYRHAKDEVSKIRNDNSENYDVIRGNLHSPRSVFEIMSKAFKYRSIAANQAGSLNKQQSKTIVLDALTRELQDRIKQDLKPDERQTTDAFRFNKYMNSLLSAAEKNEQGQYEIKEFDAAEALWSLLRKETRPKEKHGLERNKDDVRQIAEEFKEKVLEALNGIDDLNFSKEGKIEKAIADEALKIENLKKNFGHPDGLGKKAVSAITGDREATIGEILDEYNKTAEEERNKRFAGFDFYGIVKDEKGKNKPGHLNVIDELNKYLETLSDEEKQEIRALRADPYIRTDGKEIYSLQDLADVKDSAIETAAGTMVGQILKLRDIHERGKISSIIELRASSFNPFIADALNDEELKDRNRLQKTYWYISGNIYEQQSLKDGSINLVKSDKFEDGVAVYSGRLGAISRLSKSMLGLETERYREEGSLKQIFDIGGNTSLNALQYIQGYLGIRSDGRLNMEGRLERALTDPSDDPIIRFRNARKIMQDMEKSTAQLDEEAVAKLMKIETGAEKQDGDAIALLKMISDHYYDADNTSLIQDIVSTFDGKTFHSEELNKFVTRYKNNEWDIPNKAKSKYGLSGSYYKEITRWQDINDLLRTELSKEYFISKALSANENELPEGNFSGISVIKDLIESADLSYKSAETAKRVGYLGYIDNATKIFHNNSTKAEVDQATTITDAFYNIFESSDDHLKDVAETFKNIFKDQYSRTDVEKFKYDNDIVPDEFQEYVFMKKGIGPIDIIKKLNDSTKTNEEKFDYVKDFFKQFIGGRDNKQNVTSYTFAPYFFSHRLGEGLDFFGLGFSNQSTGSTLDIWKTILFKRIAPAAIGYTYLEWADDTVGAVTGTRASAAFVNGFANIDLAGRKLLDFTGASGVIDSAMDFAPFQYWNDGDNNFNTYDEEKYYYENGYEPIRKGRYWNFGSANEFRGGQIEYFRPNLTRRLNSDYFNKSMYSGYWDKWSHSLLPTPVAPLSPLFFALDPYYLEEEHKKDRPYLYSAPMFEEGTPWGIILNPTIGEFIKPKKQMNMDRMYGGTDIIAIIKIMNDRVRESAMNDDQENVFILDNGVLKARNYYDYDNPTPSEFVYKPGINERIALDENGDYAVGKHFGRINSGINIREYGDILESKWSALGISDGNGGTASGVLGGESALSKISEGILNDSFYVMRYPMEMLRNMTSTVKAAGDGPNSNEYSWSYGTPNHYSGALKAIQQANQEIRSRAIAGDHGVFVEDKLKYHDSPVNDIINRETEIQELIQKGKGQELIEQMGTSARLIGGIYGYMGNELFGLGDFNSKHIADASEMTSFSRSFWDASIGGIGGEMSEIGRRFIPEFRRRTSVNPLMNDMPDWMPEKFRLGDPYAKIPYGEARLPGKGYEALNELHPDKYGAYGALDRFKILADIAPYSEELKLWRKLAYREHANDPGALKLIDEIQDRINEQSKQHDFYDYRFIGRNVDYTEQVITDIFDNGKFKVYGSDKIYQLAGVDFPSYMGDTKEKLGMFMAPGARVTIATDSNEYHKENSDGTINAAVFLDGESVSQMLYDEKLVKKRKGTTNAADVAAMHSASGKIIGSVLELLAHTEFPLLSSRWLKIQSPMESYKDEQVYGTPYQSWADVIGTTILPSWNKAISSPVNSAFEALSFMIINNKKIMTHGRTKNMLMSGAMSIMNRGAFMGGAIMHFVKPGKGNLFYAGQKIGFAAELLGNMYTSTQSSYVGAALNWGIAGFMLGDFLDDTKTTEARNALSEKVASRLESVKSKFGEDSSHFVFEKKLGDLEEFFRGKRSAKFRAKYVAGAAAIGTFLRSMYGPSMLSENDKWTPEKTKKKWEIEDYFDRLTYLKYMGMYEKAAAKAASEEGVNIRSILEHLDDTQKEVSSIHSNLKELIETAQSHNLSNYAENRSIVEAQNRLNQIRSSKMVLKGGQYTQAAILYKQAAEATMYGLKENASWQEIASALPKYERDYFTEFMKEKDPDEQKKILSQVSPFMRRALKQIWGYDDARDKVEDNTEYFQHHNLPGPLSDIWSKDINLDDVKAKVIKNEGMLPSDFGIYESQYHEADVINAPNLQVKGTSNIVATQLKIATILNGNGLSDADVTITPSGTSGVQTVINVAKVASYNIGQMVDKLF